MMKKLFPVSLLVLFIAASLMAEGQKVLLRINGNGGQEAMVIRKGESTANAIARAEKGFSMAKVNGLADTLFNWDKTATQYSAFSFNAHDVGLQWYLPAAGGLVREFWFSTSGAPYNTIGIAHKAQVRAWYVDPRVATLPTTEWASGGTSPAGNLGYYKCVTDGEGLRTPFRDEATDTAFVNGLAAVTFDPLGKEVSTWLPGGAPIDLVPNAWHKLVIAEWGDSIPFKLGVPFGFTVQNLSSYAQIPPSPGIDTTLALRATTSLAYPYHSYKFYESTTYLGWCIRQYEWEYYVVVEYTTDRAPKAVLTQLFTTLKTTARTVTAKVTDDNPGGGTAGVKSVDLYAKTNSGAFAKTSMTGTEPNFTGTLPAANAGDTVAYYIVATDVNDNFTKSSTYSYTIFAPKYKYLCIWNGRTLPTGLTAKGAAAYYMVKDSIGEKTYYDLWDVKAFGKTDVPDLLKLYSVAVEVAGDGGQADLTGYVDAWLATATVASPKAYLMSDQDHGFISGYADTTFEDANVHAKYFGVKTLGPQDYPNGATWPWKVTPQDSTDDLTGFIQKWANKTGTTYWYDPAFELAPFTNWMDELVPTTDVNTKILFKDGTKVTGVRKNAADGSWHTMYLAFDYLCTDFRGDTSIHPVSGVAKDPKYAWILDAGSIVKNLMALVPVGVNKIEGSVPFEFSLSQNYPNPFNPSTLIEYTIPQNSFVALKVYNAIGQEVASLVNSEMNAGRYSATFDATRYSSGVYFYTLTAGSFTQTHKMVLMK